MQTPSFTTGDLNLIDRLVRVFYDPQTSFDAVREREDALGAAAGGARPPPARGSCRLGSTRPWVA